MGRSPYAIRKGKTVPPNVALLLCFLLLSTEGAFVPTIKPAPTRPTRALCSPVDDRIAPSPLTSMLPAYRAIRQRLFHASEKRTSSQASRSFGRSAVMSLSGDDLRIVSVTGSYSARLVIEVSCNDSDSGSDRRSWKADRSEEEIFALGVALMGTVGGDKLPGPPRMGSSPAVFEGYLKRLVGVPEVKGSAQMLAFLNAPEDLSGGEPVLFGEVVRSEEVAAGRRFRSADPDNWRTGSSYKRQQTNGTDKTGATVAGAVVGGLVGGPLGAAIGAVAVRAASKRDDGVGEIAKSAGAVAGAAMDKAVDIEREFEVTRKAGKAVRKATKAVQRVDEDLKVRRRAGDAAKKTVRAAKKADKDLRIRQRAAGAAKTAEQAAKRAAEAARKAEREHRVRERAGDAVRRLRKRVRRSVDSLEERRKKRKS